MGLPWSCGRWTLWVGSPCAMEPSPNASPVLMIIPGCVSAKLMRRELSRSVCDGLEQALARFGAPGQILTDNGTVFTG